MTGYDSTKPYKAAIAELIATTWDTPWVATEGTDTLYPVFRRKSQGYEVQHTDGIGSKGLLHFENATWGLAVQDALAMNFNDLLLVKARPVMLQNHIMLQNGPTYEHDHEIILILVDHLAGHCRRRQIALTGGETSIMSNLNGLDISITVTGLVESSPQNESVAGDVIIGIPSSGAHANGYGLIRSLLKSTGRGLATATRMYWDELYKHVPFIDGMMHITGGAWTKLLDILLPEHDMVIGRFSAHDIFHKLYQAWGSNDRAMYQTFNCGVGFVACVCPDYAKVILEDIPDAQIIGEVVPGRGRVVIESAFSPDELVIY